MPELPKGVDDNYTRFTPDFEPKPGESLPLPGRDIKARPVVSAVLSFLHVRVCAGVVDTTPVIDEVAYRARGPRIMTTTRGVFLSLR